ncbi:BatD family protein [Idiomarina sp. PL1-037]|uniref:BatD family protein n=1 Tax=Idiomarina sp. PL1-037 TaxID=3095365 RepID=UPI002ACBE108|nr:BatD family protein [Idiomarina sp. PL1-037]WQC53891.1 BatD family protein [Idiomarina sp. PL1-037]
MVRVWRHIILLMSFLLVSQLAYADVSEVTATVDRNPVTANESFVLTVTVDDDVANDSFSPSKLLKDFVVGRTSVSRQTSMINGKLSKQTRFTTVLIPQSAGDYKIPEISIGGASSDPISLQVLEPGNNQDNEQKVAFLEAQVDNQQVYLQQPITYVARLFLAADLNKGNLIPPEAENADIQQIGRDEESTEMVNGRRYKVYQRVYQITPSKSGSLSITGARFDGEVFTQGQRSIFSSFSNTQPVSTIAETIEVEVQAVPDNWQGHWLPSELVSVSQSVSPEQDSYTVGEPFTVSYMLTAVGVKPEQLPDIQPEFPDTVRIYPDGDETDQFSRNGVIISQKTISFAIVPNQPGPLKIPALSIPWFNTKTGSPASAKTEELNFSVAMGDGMQSIPTPNDNAEAPATEEQPENSEKPASTEVKTQSAEWSIWVISLLALALVISLILNAYLLWHKGTISQSRVPSRKPEETPRNLNKDKFWREFQLACRNNNAQEAKDSLLKWANRYFERSFNSLTELSQYLSIEASCSSLQQSLYHPGATPWQDGKVLYKEVRASIESRKNKATTKNVLPNLYGSG